MLLIKPGKKINEMNRVLGRARYLSVTEAPHEFYTWMGKKHFCFFQTAETGNRTPNSSVKGNGANHYPRAPAPQGRKKVILDRSKSNKGDGADVIVCLLLWDGTL